MVADEKQEAGFNSQTALNREFTSLSRGRKVEVIQPDQKWSGFLLPKFYKRTNYAISKP